MRRGGRRGASILVALAGVALLALNFPLMLIWDRGGALFGLPALPVALFLIWAGLIAALAWVSESGAHAPHDGPLPGLRGDDGSEDAE